MEKPQDLDKLSKCDQLRWYIINAYCNYDRIKSENNELKQKIKELNLESQRNRELAARLYKEKTKLQRRIQNQ